MRIWLVIYPGYGDHDGMPVSIHTTRRRARQRARELNSAWRDIQPYKVGSMETT